MWATLIVVVAFVFVVVVAAAAGCVTRWQCDSGNFTEYKRPPALLIALGCANTLTPAKTHTRTHTYIVTMDIGCVFVCV